MDAEMQSSVKAQVPTVCEICEETTAVKYKCVDCNSFLCERCRKFHEKVKTQNAHQIIDIRENSPALSKVSRMKLKTCKKHDDESCILYCSDCKELVCATCVATEHQKHAMQNAKTLYSEKMELVEKYEERIDNNILPNLVRKQKRLENLIVYHTQKSDKAKRKLCKWEQYLRENIIKVLETQRDELIRNLDKNLADIKESISGEISRLEQSQREIQEIRDSIKDSVQESNLGKTLDLTNTSIDTKISEVISHKANVRTKFPKFDHKPMGPMPILGELLFRNVFQLKLLTSLATGFSCVDKIIVEEAGTVLLRDLETKTVKQMRIEGDNLSQIEKWTADVKDMASLESGEILSIISDKTEIRILKIDNDQTYTVSDVDITKTFFDTAPQMPTAIHVSRENKIIISTVEPGRDVIPMDEPCKVQIFVLTPKGELQSCFDFDRNLFCFPDKISSVNDLICIADSVSDYSGRIVALDGLGNVKWTYGDLNSSLIISDMVHTPMDNIVLLQVCQGRLVVLDTDGVCLNKWTLTDLGISHPYSLNIDKNDHLLIGCGVNGNNLHIMEFIES